MHSFFEPFEYQEYVVDLSMADARIALDSELTAVGFLPHIEQVDYPKPQTFPQYPMWERGDLVVGLEPGKTTLPSRAGEGTIIYVLRYLDYGSISQFRVWLFDERED
ncbi:MAG TPA: hypothetical protein PKA27_15800 [Fimbriimonadaceae bacterium]|nr:hypothetical protein [Fimbriimonadaceae bacterium]